MSPVVAVLVLGVSAAGAVVGLLVRLVVSLAGGRSAGRVLEGVLL